MSFSKARIQRFNEIGSEVPPPGSYDPKFDFTSKGHVIDKADRFQENKSVIGGECNLSLSSKSTGSQVVATFRTPQLPRKRTTIKPTSSSSSSLLTPKVKPRVLINNKEWKYDSELQLADLQVECVNKDKTIQEQEKHIDEMKDAVRSLEFQLEDLRNKQAEVEAQHKQDLERMAAMHLEVSNGHQEKHQQETEMLRSQLIEVTEEKERELEARKAMENDLRSRIAEFSNRVAALEADLAERKRINDETVQSLERRMTDIVMEMEKVNVDHKIELTLWEKEKAELDRCVSDLQDERSQLELKLEKRQNVVLELQAQLSALQCELDELRAEYEKLIDDTAKQVQELNETHQNEINTWKTNLEKEQQLVQSLNNRLREAEEELEEADKKHNMLVQKHTQELQNLRNSHQEEKAKLTQVLEDAQQIHYQEMKNLTLAKDREVAEIKEASNKKIDDEKRRIQEHAAKIVENAEAVTRETLAACRAESEERVKRVIAESDAKVNAMIRDARSAVEEEMRITAERYKACLARIEIERAALDEKLSQRDAEITKLSATLEELKASAETQESFGQSLQMELDRAETELAEKKQELRALKDQIRSEAAEMVARRKRFEVIMAENQASVAALTKRLAQSNAEVERLQNELKRGEECIHEHRDLLSLMRNNSQIVHEQVHVLMEQLDAKKSLVDQLEADSMSEFESIKSVFEAKIENLKQVAANEIARLQEECEKKTNQNTEIMNQVHDMAKSLSQAQEMLVELENRNDAQEVNISRIEVLNKKLEEELKNERARVAKHEVLKAQKEQDKIALDKANAVINALTEKIKMLADREQSREDNSAAYDDERRKWKELEAQLLQQVEVERNLREKAEVDAKTLNEHNKRLQNDYADITEKYAEVLGHQNQKQRIKHITQLKTKIEHLEEKEKNMLKTIEQQQRTIEKLKADDKRTHRKGKENILAVSRSIHTSTPASSPIKSLTPLKNRNE